jgi:hypothetical protein
MAKKKTDKSIKVTEFIHAEFMRLKRNLEIRVDDNISASVALSLIIQNIEKQIENYGIENVFPDDVVL